jgi:hypothetical protein
VKHILRRHRGHLAIASELGHGTTATVYLPAVERLSSPAPGRDGPAAAGERPG